MRTLLVDSSYLLFRSHFAYPNLTHQGKSSGAFFGYVKGILRFMREYKPDNIVIAQDLPEPTWRHKLYDGYKAGRPAPDPEMVAQIPLINDWCSTVFSNTFAKSGFEADDIIFTSALQLQFGARHKNLTLGHDLSLQDLPQDAVDHQVLIFSADKDLYQTYIVPSVQFIHQNKAVLELKDRQAFIDKHELSPIQWIDYKALVGDNSDNLKGIDGIGPKTAVKLLHGVTSLYDLFAYLGLPNEVYRRSAIPQSPEMKSRLEDFVQDPKNNRHIEKIKEQHKQLTSTYQLGCLHIVPGIEIKERAIDLAAGLGKLEAFGFRSLIKEVQALATPQELQETLF
jgi:DNA polymerase-1